MREGCVYIRTDALNARVIYVVFFPFFFLFNSQRDNRSPSSLVDPIYTPADYRGRGRCATRRQSFCGSYAADSVPVFCGVLAGRDMQTGNLPGDLIFIWPATIDRKLRNFAKYRAKFGQTRVLKFRHYRVKSNFNLKQ